MTHNRQIINIYEDDLSDRLVRHRYNLKIIHKKDRERLKNVKEILKQNPILSKKGLYCVAFLLHHSRFIVDNKKAISYVIKSMDARYEKAKWLYAAIIDNILLKKGKKQKFGTQYEKYRGKLRLRPWDKRTTDKERAKYNIQPIQEILDEIPHLTPWWKQKKNKK